MCFCGYEKKLFPLNGRNHPQACQSKSCFSTVLKVEFLVSELELAAVHLLGSSKGWRASLDGPGSPEGTPSRRSTWQGTAWSGRLTSSELGIESQIEAGIDAGKSSLDWAAVKAASPLSPSRSVDPRPSCTFLATLLHYI